MRREEACTHRYYLVGAPERPIPRCLRLLWTLCWMASLAVLLLGGMALLVLLLALLG